MLFLQHAADGSDAPVQVPVDDAVGLHLERAVLAADAASRLSAVNQALAADSNLAAWALSTAEVRSGRTINRVEDAAGWLSQHLVVELGSAISSSADADVGSVSWRLSALLKKLLECERATADFECKLEREKLDAMKEIAYGASHEINNPLANIAARAQTLLDGEHNPERRQKLVAIHRQAMRAHEMISDLMLFARPPKLSRRPFELAESVQCVIDGLADFAEEQNVAVAFSATEEPIEVMADETQISVAVHSLIKNAIEAVSDGGHVNVVLRTVAQDGKSAAEISVRDDGPGIPDAVRAHIFDPFFSGREAGRGLGFGLSKCWRIVTDHGGEIVVARSGGGGAEISILLPLSPVPFDQSTAR